MNPRIFKDKKGKQMEVVSTRVVSSAFSAAVVQQYLDMALRLIDAKCAQMVGLPMKKKRKKKKEGKRKN